MNRRIVMIAGGAALAIIAAWFLLLWSPKGGELADARARKATAAQKVSELELKLARLKDAQRNEPQLLATRDRLNSAVPDQPDLGHFILDVNDAASKAGVDFLSITPAPTAVAKIPGQPPEIKIDITTSGAYEATLNFIDRLSELRRVVVFDQVRLTPSEGDVKLNADLGGSIFTTKEPPAPPTPAVAGAAAAGTPTTSTTVKP